MKPRIKSVVIVAGVVLALATTALAAWAAPSLARVAQLNAQPAEAEALQKCTKMQASEVFWVTLNEDGDIEEEVTEYPEDTNTITPVFEYNCVPKNTKITTVFIYDGETVFTDKESLKASSQDGLYGYPIGTTDGSPMDLGEWGVEFYNNKTLLTSGTVWIGEGEEPKPEPDGETVVVEGVFADKKTKKPIKNALFIVLNPGVTLDDWFENDQSDEDVYTSGVSDSKGVFVLELELERNVEYAVLAVAKGYKPVGADDFLVTDEDPNPLELEILLSK